MATTGGPVLEAFVNDLHRYLNDHLPAVWQLTIADNGSSDDTWSIATGLAETLPDTRAARLEERLGRKELRFRWNHSQALVAAFIEIQPSPDFDRTLAPLIKGANLQSQPMVAVDKRFTRRQALTAIGTVGLGAFLAACAGNATSTTIAGSTTTSTTGTTDTSGTGVATATTAVTAIDCILVPEMTEGP